METASGWWAPSVETRVLHYSCCVASSSIAHDDASDGSIAPLEQEAGQDVVYEYPQMSTSEHNVHRRTNADLSPVIARLGIWCCAPSDIGVPSREHTLLKALLSVDRLDVQLHVPRWRDKAQPARPSADLSAEHFNAPQNRHIRPSRELNRHR